MNPLRFALRQRRSVVATAALAAFAVPIAAAPPALAQTTAAPAADAPLPKVRLTPETLAPSNVNIAPDASGGLKLTFSPADYPSVMWNIGRAYDAQDWSGCGGMVWTVRNPNDAPLTVLVRVDDDPKADGQNHCRTGNATLAPGETATLVFPFSATSPGMNAGPPLVPNPNARFFTIYGSSLNEKNIVAFQIFLAQPKANQTVELQSVRLVPKPSLVGIVDEFGQYAKAEWPGKLKSGPELVERMAEENMWLAAHPPPPDRDEYGGWKTGPLLKATGFFRTALVGAGSKEITAPKPGNPMPDGSRFWLVTPNGHLFWSAGVDCVRPYAEGKIDGREAMFTRLTDDWKKRGQTDFYFDNIQKKYGENWKTNWINSDVSRMKSWGFNTVGNWSDPDLFRAKRVSYTVPLYVNGLPPLAAEGNGFGLPDYFDPKFPELARGSCVNQTKEWKADPWCVGYFIDNELAWDSWAQMGTGGAYVAAREAIAAPPSLAARQAFVKILQAKYPTPEAWGKAWNVSTVTGWNAQIRVDANALTVDARADCAAFSTALAQRYFSVMRAAIKEAAPNQLYLGCRFAMRPPEMVAVAAKYCDVVSFNIYDDAVDPKTWAFTSTLGKPVLIGEYHFGATDRGVFHPGLRARANQSERARAFQNYVKSVRAMPAFVGCHWFQWIDEPLTGRFDGENYNIGFVTVTDTPYPEMRDAARRVNASLYAMLKTNKASTLKKTKPLAAK